MSSQNDDAAFGPVDRGLFRRVCGRFATGVTVVTTTRPDGLPHGLTVNSFSSVSLEPPLVLVSIDSRNSVLQDLLNGSPFAINILASSGREVSQRFSAPLDARFEGISWVRGVTGAPLLPDTLGHFECILQKAVVAGDHTVLIAEVKQLRLTEAVSSQGEPLVYFDSAYRLLG